MAAEVSKSSSSADSYLGSLISLTSKSEIRYEGVLYSINPDESSIGLQNVRSFGSEGRKKDGPQIPPSDRVYEYILFRGTDIKDLQVKSSPPVQTTSSIDNDPAIIQSHYPRPPAPSTSLPPAVSVSPTDVNSHAPQLGHPGSNFPGGIPLYQPAPSTSFPPAVSVSPTDVNSHAPQLGHPGSNFPGGIPLYQPGASLGSWGPSPPPSVNGNPLPMPMYWPGMYGPPNGLPHLHQQTLLQPSPGLSVPPSLHQPMQFSGYSAPPQASAPNVPNPNLNLLTTSSSSNVFGFNPPPPVGTLNASSSGSPLLATSSTSSLPLSLPVVPSVTSASEPPSSSVFNKGSNSVLPSMALNVNLPTSLPLAISNSETTSISAPVSSKVNTVPSSLLPYPNLSQPTTSIIGSSTPNLSEVPTPSLVTPGQLLLSGQSKTSSESSQTVHKDVEVVQVSSSSEQSESVLKEKEAQPPILPLPSAPRTYNKPHPHGAPHARHYYRGSVRGRGTGGSRPFTRFTEDFDFTAMNEKFNKDEVWGELGKKNKDGDENDDGDYEDEDSTELANIEAKAVYNKDDFFDSLSSNSLNNTSQNGRPRFSEQLKLDAETFGESGRYNRGGRGGRGFARGGRNSNYGRGYGYSASGRGGYGYGGRGRGRGRAIYSQAS